MYVVVVSSASLLVSAPHEEKKKGRGRIGGRSYACIYLWLMVLLINYIV